MTDKPIIIDGIDVSECEHITYKDSLNPMCGNTGICCYGRENCYFKQLTRKTQEYEELKKQIDSDKGLITDAGKQNYQLVQEYDKLKTENERLMREILDLFSATVGKDK